MDVSFQAAAAVLTEMVWFALPTFYLAVVHHRNQQHRCNHVAKPLRKVWRRLWYSKAIDILFGLFALARLR